MNINPYLGFDGNCEEAFKFYEQILGGKIEAMMPYEGTPAEKHMPPEFRKKIMHARLVVDGQAIMGGDAPPGKYEAPKGFNVSINLKDKAQGEKIFQSLSQGGKVGMPFQETFWAAGFGMTVDRFGIPWLVNCEKQA